jgi:hypothetical protein
MYSQVAKLTQPGIGLTLSTCTMSGTVQRVCTKPTAMCVHTLFYRRVHMCSRHLPKQQLHLRTCWDRLFCRTFQTKIKAEPNIVVGHSNNRWKRLSVGLILGLSVASAAYYFSLEQPERRKIHVFVGGIGRFMR